MKPSLSRLAVLIPCGLLLATATGCIDKSVEGDRITYTYQLWVPSVLLLIGLIAAPGGWMLRGVSQRFGYGLLFVSLLILVIGPGLFLDRVEIDGEHLSLRTGFWFYPTMHDVKWADVSSMSMIQEVKAGRRGRKNTSYYFNCQTKSGEVHKVPIGTLMEEAVEDVMSMAEKKGIKVDNLIPQ